MTRGRASLRTIGPAVVFLLAGCSSAREEFLPVEGMIRVQGQPLPAGTVVFHPDAASGNTSKQEPRATINEREPGKYRLTTDGHDGAPPGHYQVTVFALAPITRENSQHPPEWLADPRYADVKTSRLTVVVRRDAGADAYDFDLQAPPRR
jgi:hypothetical protein